MIKYNNNKKKFNYQKYKKNKIVNTAYNNSNNNYNSRKYINRFNNKYYFKKKVINKKSVNLFLNIKFKNKLKSIYKCIKRDNYICFNKVNILNKKKIYKLYLLNKFIRLYYVNTIYFFNRYQKRYKKKKTLYNKKKYNINLVGKVLKKKKYKNNSFFKKKKKELFKKEIFYIRILRSLLFGYFGYKKEKIKIKIYKLKKEHISKNILSFLNTKVLNKYVEKKNILNLPSLYKYNNIFAFLFPVHFKKKYIFINSNLYYLNKQKNILSIKDSNYFNSLYNINSPNNIIRTNKFYSNIKKIKNIKKTKFSFFNIFNLLYINMLYRKKKHIKHNKKIFNKKISNKKVSNKKVFNKKKKFYKRIKNNIFYKKIKFWRFKKKNKIRYMYIKSKKNKFFFKKKYLEFNSFFKKKHLEFNTLSNNRQNIYKKLFLRKNNKILFLLNFINNVGSIENNVLSKLYNKKMYINNSIVKKWYKNIPLFYKKKQYNYINLFLRNFILGLSNLVSSIHNYKIISTIKLLLIKSYVYYSKLNNKHNFLLNFIKNKNYIRSNKLLKINYSLVIYNYTYYIKKIINNILNTKKEERLLSFVANNNSVKDVEFISIRNMFITFKKHLNINTFKLFNFGCINYKRGSFIKKRILHIIIKRNEKINMQYNIRFNIYINLLYKCNIFKYIKQHYIRSINNKLINRKNILNVKFHETNANARYIITNYNNSKIIHSRSVGSLGIEKEEKRIKKWRKKLGEHLSYWVYKTIRRKKNTKKRKYRIINLKTIGKRRIIKFLFFKLKSFLKKRKFKFKRIFKKKFKFFFKYHLKNHK